MDEKELRAKFNESALNVIREGAFELFGVTEDGYRDAINYIQGVLEMVSALDKVLNEQC